MDTAISGNYQFSFYQYKKIIVLANFPASTNIVSMAR